jgi:PmbA protein
MQEVDGTRIPELKNIVSESLQLARRLGASQAESDVSLQKGLTTTVRLGEVETVEYQRDRGMGITVYFGQRKGSASTADLSTRAVAETVEKACDIARYTAEDNCSGLADPEELARDIPDLDLDHPLDLPPEQAVSRGSGNPGTGAMSIRESPIQRAPASAATAASVCMATRMAFSKAFLPPVTA